MMCKDQIIVTELRPMSEAKGDVTSQQILIYFYSNNPNVDDVYAEASYFNHAIDNWNYTQFNGYSIIGWIPMPIYKPKKAEAFHQKDVPGRLREISGVDEARDLGESAAKCMTELMQTKEGG